MQIVESQSAASQDIGSATKGEGIKARVPRPSSRLQDLEQELTKLHQQKLINPIPTSAVQGSAVTMPFNLIYGSAPLQNISYTQQHPMLLQSVVPVSNVPIATISSSVANNSVPKSDNYNYAHDNHDSPTPSEVFNYCIFCLLYNLSIRIFFNIIHYLSSVLL